MNKERRSKEVAQEKELGSSNPVIVGISMGDCNGIGTEVLIKIFEDHRMLLDCTPVIYGSTRVLSFYKKIMEANDFAYQTIAAANEIVPRKINVINVTNEEVQIEMGKPTEHSGKLAYASLEAATTDLAAGKVDVLVTAPISKEAMAKADFKFPGHTEYLGHLAGNENPLMVMVSGNLRVALATTHIPLKEVSSALTRDRIVEKIKALNATLRKDFGVLRPKIAVFGLNPHAGENGKMGSEESEVIIPAINQVKGEDILAYGPYPADGFFGSGMRHDFDAVLAMYHDQGLTAFKALAFEDGVNYTGGLPIVRTSPDHGTAYDIVGQNKASESSMRQAIYLAMDVHRNRLLEKEINKNPLQVTVREKRAKTSEIE